jgi:hypothetical protein
MNDQDGPSSSALDSETEDPDPRFGSLRRTPVLGAHR